MMTQGKLYSAKEAFKIGIVDEVVPEGSFEDLLLAAEEFVLSERVQKTPIRDRVISQRAIASGGTVEYFDMKKAEVVSNCKAQDGSLAVLQALQGALQSSSFLEGESIETLLFEKLAKSKQSRALQYLHLAEGKHANIKESLNKQPKGQLRELADSLLRPLAVEAFLLLEEGVSISQINIALKNTVGFSKGFFGLCETFELVGSVQEQRELLASIEHRREQKVFLKMIILKPI